MTIFHRPSETRLLPEGDYRGTVLSAETATSNSGNPKLIVQYLVEHEGKHRITEHVPMHIGWRVAQLCDAFGEATVGNTDSFDADKLEGLPCSLSVKHEEWDGKTQLRVSRLEKADPEEASDDCPF